VVAGSSFLNVFEAFPHAIDETFYQRRVICWILAYLSQNTSSTKRDKAKEKNESDREIRKSGGTNRNKQWDKKARTLQSNMIPLVGLKWGIVSRVPLCAIRSLILLMPSWYSAR
jgi:hypothetical protein